MRTRSLLLALAVTVSLGALALPEARAESPVPAAIEAPGADAPSAEREAYWRARGDAARERVRVAQARLDMANADITRMRNRNHPRGAARAALFAVRDEARDELEEARHSLEVELPEEARQAGGHPAWVSG